MNSRGARLQGVGGTMAELLSAQLSGVRIRIRTRRRGHPRVSTGGSVRAGLSVLGFALALLPTPAAAKKGPANPLRRIPNAPEPPWSRTSGSPPPRPLVLTGGQGTAAGDDNGAASPGVGAGSPDAQAEGPDTRQAHPAIHGRLPHGRGAPGPLFPRSRPPHPAPAHPSATPPRAQEHERSVQGPPELEAGTRQGRSPADPQRGPSQLEARVFAYSPPERAEEHAGAVPSGGRSYVVRPGDTLWGIAEKVLGTDEPARVARYWPLIHRLNRDTVGPDPSLIVPGQILELPPERSR